MASETVDPIDWSHPSPYTGQYPLSSTYCTLQLGLGCKSQDLLHWVSRERATFGMPDELYNSGYNTQHAVLRVIRVSLGSDTRVACYQDQQMIRHVSCVLSGSAKGRTRELRVIRVSKGSDTRVACYQGQQRFRHVSYVLSGSAKDRTRELRVIRVSKGSDTRVASYQGQQRVRHESCVLSGSAKGNKVYNRLSIVK